MQSEADLELRAISKMTSDSNDPRGTAGLVAWGFLNFF